MENALTVAIGKAIKAKVLKEASKGLEPGQYKIDGLFRLLGDINKGEDFKQKLAAKINFALLACLALSKLNEATVDSIIEDFIMAMGRSELSPEHAKLIDQIKDKIRPKLDAIKEMTTTTMSGKVTTNVSIEEVGNSKLEKVA